MRLAYWAAGGSKGTVLLFPGRTEHIEKYGRVVHDLVAEGYAAITIDWRGQGYSDRLTGDRHLGHVGDFKDYQLDVAEMIGAAREADLPQPWYLLSHSMGGSIALRSLIEGIPVRRAVFSAPMWGLRLPYSMRILPFVLPPLFRLIGRHETYTPGTRQTNYVSSAEFHENLLTSDSETFGRLARNARSDPAFAIGGPSIHWVGRAALEGRRLSRLPRPKVPVLTVLGTNEGVVSTDAIHRIHANWPTARIRIVPDARHELMMEAPERRAQFFDELFSFLAAD